MPSFKLLAGFSSDHAMLLLLKLTLVPAIILLISGAAARWGTRIAGVLAGFPIVAGPILLFLALEQGTAFAAQSAISTLYGLLSLIGYCLCFSWLCLRLRWWGCLTLSWCGFVATAALLHNLPVNLPAAAGLSLAVILLAPRAFPALPSQQAPQAIPGKELLWRMAAGAALVLSLTSLANGLGPSWSGLLTPFPVAGSVLGAFMLHRGGSAHASNLLRAMVQGLLGLWAFFVTAAFGFGELGLAAFLPALALAIAVQAWLLTRKT